MGQPRYRGDLNKYDEEGLNYNQLKEFFSERGDSLGIFNFKYERFIKLGERLYQEKKEVQLMKIYQIILKLKKKVIVVLKSL